MYLVFHQSEMWIHLDETLTDKSLILLLLSSVNPLPATVPILPAWLRKQMHTGMIGTLDATISFWKKGESERESILNTLFIHTIRNIYNKMFNLVLLESLPMTEVATGAARHLVKGGSCHPLPNHRWSYILSSPFAWQHKHQDSFWSESSNHDLTFTFPRPSESPPICA